MYDFLWNFAVCTYVVFGISSVSGICPNIVSREEWQGRPPKSIENMTMPVSNFVIHHTVMGEGNCTTFDECVQVMIEIQSLHMDDNDWADIGYSFLIGSEGSIFEGRGWNRVGAHAPGMNDKSIGISLIGNFMNHLPPEIQINSTLSIMQCAVELGHVTQEYLVYGHRDVSNTACPGDQLYDEISLWPDKATPSPVA